MTSISSKKPTWNWLAIKWLGIISLFLTSCDAPKEIGADLFSVEVGLNYTDTLTIKSATVLMDSIQTGGNSTFSGAISCPSRDCTTISSHGFPWVSVNRSSPAPRFLILIVNRMGEN